jgi:hypothetical protein
MMMYYMMKNVLFSSEATDLGVTSLYSIGKRSFLSSAKGERVTYAGFEASGNCDVSTTSTQMS